MEVTVQLIDDSRLAIYDRRSEIENRQSVENFGIKIFYKQSKFSQRIETTQRIRAFIRWVVSIRWS
jgi:hypothetical protein